MKQQQKWIGDANLFKYEYECVEKWNDELLCAYHILLLAHSECSRYDGDDDREFT